MMGAASPLLAIESLHKHFGRPGPFGRRRDVLHAVDGVSLAVAPGETLGLVGESGCGKSTLARVALRLLPPTSGTVRFEGRDVFAARGEELRALRRGMQIVFQDASGALHPRMRVGEAIAEVLAVHRLAGRKERPDRVGSLLGLVGLDPEHVRRYPHELSGGQRQRVVIARALAVGPRLLVCDEPVSALDVSVQAQILNLLADLQARLGLGNLLISHDLRVVRQLCRRVAVMYLGRIVEEGPAGAVYEEPRHPYTRALLAAIPVAVPGRRPGAMLPEEPAGPAARPVQGCAFAPRCPDVRAECRREDPVPGEVAPQHSVACHLYPERRPAIRTRPDP